MLSEVELLSKKSNKLKSLLYKIKINFVDNIEHLLPAPSFILAGLIISGRVLDTSLHKNSFRKSINTYCSLSGSNVSIIGEAIREDFSFFAKIFEWYFRFDRYCFIWSDDWRWSNSLAISNYVYYWHLTQLTGRRNSGCIALMTAGACMLFQTLNFCFMILLSN